VNWRRNSGSCSLTSQGRTVSGRDVVRGYIRDHRERAAREVEFFKRCRTLSRAIEFATLAKLPSGKRHPHQRRIPRQVLTQAERNLQAMAFRLRQCRSFTEMHDFVGQQIGAVRGIGPLTVYDVATRIGAHLGFEPELVYLHAGTAKGAKVLGFDHCCDTLDPAKLPRAFRALRPREIEDCLCIYKAELAGLNAQPRAAAHPARATASGRLRVQRGGPDRRAGSSNAREGKSKWKLANTNR